MNIISIQSHVAYGHVGNSAAVFPLQRIGVEVWPIHTVQFSNHAGYETLTGQVFEAAAIRDIVAGIAARGALSACDGVLSGYMGSAEIGSAILDTAVSVKAANSKALYCCDPVMGDVDGGLYVRGGVPEFMKDRAVPAADVVTPNQFELDYLSGRGSATLPDAVAAIDAIHARGPRAILVTSLQTADTPVDAVDLVASDSSAKFLVRTPKLPISPNGAGDAIAALFFAFYLRTGAVHDALAQSASAIFGILKRTADAGTREIQLIAAQDEIVSPTLLFEPERIGG